MIMDFIPARQAGTSEDRRASQDEVPMSLAQPIRRALFVVVSVGLAGLALAQNPMRLLSTADGSFSEVAISGDATVAVVTGGVGTAQVWRILGGTATNASVNTSGVAANQGAFGGRVSRNGAVVAFLSTSTNLITSGLSGSWAQVFVRVPGSNLTELVSRVPGGAEGNGESASPSLSQDGRYVAFSSYASNLVAGDANGKSDIFVVDRVAGAITRVNAPGGVEADQDSIFPVISADGSKVVFTSFATNLVAGDTNGSTDITQGADVFVVNRDGTGLQRVSLSAEASELNGPSGRTGTAISANGSHVAFDTDATNWIASDTNSTTDVVVVTLATFANRRGSQTLTGGAANGPSGFPFLSSDGRFLSYGSSATNPTPGSAGFNVYVRDMASNEVWRMGLSTSLGAPNSEVFASGVSDDGRYVASITAASNVNSTDTDALDDAYLTDRGYPNVPGSAIVLYDPTIRRLGYWTAPGGTITGWRTVGTVASGWEPRAGFADVNANYDPDAFLLRLSDQSSGAWLLNANTITGWLTTPKVAAGWQVVGLADMSGDSFADLVVMRTSDRQLGAYTMRPGVPSGWMSLPRLAAGQIPVGLPDLDGDGKADIAMRNSTTGSVGAWTMDRGTITGWRSVGTVATAWVVRGWGDFNNDGKVDLLMQDGSRRLGAYLLNNGPITGWRSITTVGANWTVVGTARKSL